MAHTTEQKVLACEKDVPLFKVEIDFRHSKDKSKRYRRQTWGAATDPKIIELLNEAIRLR
jgi:hypothetical protein